ncbi:carboxylate-amine ligase [Saccharothrix luteola]|uniref:carboxylate-amine ligase n=1 Tax=Saccharothrix luteola TaxID=2893018 RepID=UPI001E552EE0|nr:glutamate--cysteine ligase [Saccharothrix luteola]MCC8242721.1 glutamate--cysteine ligase [Saccharothrix luteola]
MGVEEEFLLVDRTSLWSAGNAVSVLERAADMGLGHGCRLQRELWDSEVETNTGVCTDLAGLREDLIRNRLTLARAAEAEGLAPVSVGYPLYGTRPAPLNPDASYRPLREVCGGILADQEICGCHVHVGVDDRDTGVAVLNHLAPWLPTLLALTANSPFRQGRDTGFHSWRMMVYHCLPGSGIPPWFASAAEYDADLARLKECGLLPPDHGGLRPARLSDHLPTVEVRVGDAAATVDEAVLYAALVRGLVRTALTDLDAGREARRLSDVVLADALWAAARYGPPGRAVDPWTGAGVPATTLAARLLLHITPALAASGDLDEVRSLLDRVLNDGGAATRQRRAAAEHGLSGVLAMLVRGTVRHEPEPIGRNAGT